MRTTLTLADDVTAAVERLCRERAIGISEAVNGLIRAGLVAESKPRKPFRQKSYDIGIHLNVDNVAEALETVEGPAQT